MSLYEFVIGSLVGKLSLPVLDLQWINGNFSRPRGNLSIPDCFPPMLPHIFIVTSTKISIEHLVSNNGLVVAFGVGDGLLNSTAEVTHARDDVIHAPVPRSGTNMNRNWTNIWWYLSDPMGTPLASFGNEDGHLKNIPKCCQKNLEHDLSDFPFSWECRHHPSWRTHIFQYGYFTANQWNMMRRGCRLDFKQVTFFGNVQGQILFLTWRCSTILSTLW